MRSFVLGTDLFLLLVYGIHHATTFELGLKPFTQSQQAARNFELDRRRAVQAAFLTTTCGMNIMMAPAVGIVSDSTNLKQIKSNYVSVVLQSAQDSIGVQVRERTLDGDRHIVEIEKIIEARNPALKVGMIVQDASTTQELLERLSGGPFPLTINFSVSIDSVASETMKTLVDNVAPGSSKDVYSLATSPPSFREYSRKVLQPSPSNCIIQSREGDILELEYDAYYWSADGTRKVLYDSSSFRGTGLPYQTVLGSGDMIPGVDLGLYDMCPGETRQLLIPAIAGYGPRARAIFKIPQDHRGLEWEVRLISIDYAIRMENEDVMRGE